MPLKKPPSASRSCPESFADVSTDCHQDESDRWPRPTDSGPGIDHGGGEIEIVVDFDLDDFDPSPRLLASLQSAVRTAAQHRGISAGKIGVLVTDDVTIREINRRHLEHDYATDVISFTYHRQGDCVEGELVVSLTTARRTAAELGWDWSHELLLYVTHGTLHICGLEDTTDGERRRMREAESDVLIRLGIADARRYSPDQAVPTR